MMSMAVQITTRDLQLHSPKLGETPINHIMDPFVPVPHDSFDCVQLWCKPGHRLWTSQMRATRGGILRLG